MARIGGEAGFDATQDYRANIEKGWHLCAITEADVKKSKKGDDMVVLEFKILEGEDKGGGVRLFLNLYHPTTKVRGIAEKQFAEVVKACGLATVRDTDELLNRVLKVYISPDGDFDRADKFAKSDSTPETDVPAVATGETW